MRIGDVLYFSPKYRFSDLDFDKPDAITAAFQDRVEGFYFRPAAHLIEAGDAFAAGLVICAAIEFIATAWSRQQPQEWLESNLPAFAVDKALAASFWQNFRHGITHEGRIKSFGQFSLDFPDMLAKVDNALIVNPRLLLSAAMETFQSQCSKISTSRSKVLVQNLRRHFEAEVKAARK